MTNLTDLVALVTGAGHGISKASAVALAEAGAHVIVNDIDGVNAEATADAIMTGQRRAVPVQADVGDLQEIDRMVRGGACSLWAHRHPGEQRVAPRLWTSPKRTGTVSIGSTQRGCSFVCNAWRKR